MVCVAVICEYNPFHNGHKYHIDSIRRTYGDDCAVIALMSGNYTQRGDLALTDKVCRAAAAVSCGVNLVLELPFPYSAASADMFAAAAVHILCELGAVDVLSFGSECGDTARLLRVAQRTAADDFRDKVKSYVKEHPAVGYAAAVTAVYHTNFGDGDTDIFTEPNNTLALAYLRAAYEEKAPFSYHTVTRVGSAYNETALAEKYPSATALRSAISEGRDIRGFVPAECFPFLEKAVAEGRLPADAERLYPAVLSSFLLNDSGASECNIQDATGGLYHRLRRFSKEATSLSSLIALSETKKFTRARIRRAVLFSLLGVTSSDAKSQPAYTQLLAADCLGLSVLKKVRKTADIPILTKPADTARLSGAALRQKALSDKADMLYAVATPQASLPADALRFTPFIKK